MNIRDRRIYHAQAALLASTAIGALWVLVDGLGLLLGTVMALAQVVTLQHAWRRRQQPTEQKPAEAVAAAGMGLALLIFFVAGLLPAMIVLLLGVQLAQNMLLREHRQLKFGWLVGFAVLMAGAVQSEDNGYLLVFALFALFLVLGLGYSWLDRHNHTLLAPRWSIAAQLRVLSGWLFLAFVLYLITPRLDPLLWGDLGTFGGGGYDDRSWERAASPIRNTTPAAANRAGDAAGSAGGTGDAQRSDSGTGDYQGFAADQFDITEPDPQGSRISNVQVLSMRAPHGAYLRLRVFDEFDGTRWHNTLQDYHLWRGDRGWFHFDGDGAIATNYSHQLKVLAALPAAIPTAAPAVNLRFPARALKRTEYGTFEAPTGLRPGTEFTVDSLLTHDAGRLVDRLSPGPRPQDSRVPASLDPRVAQLAGQITAGHEGVREKARALEQHLRTGYAYSLDAVVSSQNRTPLGEFLFETRRGHCEFFASALAVMLRTQGIATRLATGFSATTYNPITGRYEIRVLDGHAWVEVWTGSGWMLFEPTPFYPLPQPTEGRLTAEQIETYLERLQAIDDALGVDATGAIPPERLLLAFWHAVIEAANLAIAAFAWLLLAMWPLWLALAGAAAAAWALWRYRRDALLDWLSDRRVARYRFAHDGTDFHYVFRHAQACLARQGHVRRPGQALAEFCTQLERDGRLSHDHAELVAATRECFEQARPWQAEWRELLLAFYADLRSRK